MNELAVIAAYHEAGHAVVSHFLDYCRPIDRVVIDDDGSGCVSYMDTPEPTNRILRLRDEAKASLAGDMAEKRYTREEIGYSSLRDLDAVDDLREAYGDDREEFQEELREITVETYRLIEERWLEIEAVAAALLHRRELTRDQIQCIIEDRPDPDTIANWV